MHPDHEKQVNQTYTTRAAECWRAQLDHALAAVLTTNKEAATHWVEQVERLVGRIVLSENGGTIRSAARYLDPLDCPCMDEYNKKQQMSPTDRLRYLLGG